MSPPSSNGRLRSRYPGARRVPGEHVSFHLMPERARSPNRRSLRSRWSPFHQHRRWCRATHRCCSGRVRTGCSRNHRGGSCRRAGAPSRSEVTRIPQEVGRDPSTVHQRRVRRAVIYTTAKSVGSLTTTSRPATASAVPDEAREQAARSGARVQGSPLARYLSRTKLGLRARGTRETGNDDLPIGLEARLPGAWANVPPTGVAHRSSDTLNVGSSDSVRLIPAARATRSRRERGVAHGNHLAVRLAGTCLGRWLHLPPEPRPQVGRKEEFVHSLPPRSQVVRSATCSTTSKHNVMKPADER